MDFFILSPKSSLGGYHIILGQPWLVTIDAFIACQLGKMTISNGANIKNLALYSPAKPLLQDDKEIWPDLGDNET